MDVTAISVVNTEKKSEQYQGTSGYKLSKSKTIVMLKINISSFTNGLEMGINIIKWIPNTNTPILSLKEGLHQIGNVVIRNFELYQLDQSTNSETNPGTAFADLEA